MSTPNICSNGEMITNIFLNEPRREKTGFLHMLKQGRRSAVG